MMFADDVAATSYLESAINNNMLVEMVELDDKDIDRRVNITSSTLARLKRNVCKTTTHHQHQGV